MTMNENLSDDPKKITKLLDELEALLKSPSDAARYKLSEAALRELNPPLNYADLGDVIENYSDYLEVAGHDAFCEEIDQDEDSL